MISVIIPLYNKEAQIASTLQTVLNQTYQDFEIVIVNDGSTDNSVAEVNKIKDNRIRVINQKNAGVSAARNRGIKEAQYDLVAFLDADDEWKPRYLETQYTLYLKYPKCSVFAVNYEFRNLKGEVTHTIINKLSFDSEYGILTNYFEVASCSHPPICSISIMVKKNAIESIGGFPDGIKSGEDLLTWAKLAVKYKIAYCKTPYAIYNLGEGYDFNNAPPRRQDANDPVGESLKIIYKENKGIKGLKSYLSLWYKMRASVAIRYGERTEAFVEICKSLKYNFLNFKIYPFLILIILPFSVQKKIFKLIKK